MEYLYTKLLDGAHELQTMAKADWDKHYKDSCIKAITDISVTNAKRAKLIRESEELATELMELYDLDDRVSGSEVLEKIAKNLR